MKVKTSLMPEIQLKFIAGDIPHHKIRSAVHAVNLLRDLYNPDTIELYETFIVLFLNRVNRTIGWMKLGDGGTSSVIVDKKLMFATALKCNAHSMILSHNHPSGEVHPSAEDIQLTSKIKEAGKLLSIHVYDHIILTPYLYYSFIEEGLM